MSKKGINQTHGYTRGGTPGHRRPQPVYVVWQAMLRRCRNPKADLSARYLGRGIKVCDRWYKFENFLADMGEPPPGLTLDRIDNDGDYTPDNCRWATTKEQARNRRSNVWIEFGGMRETQEEWARTLGVSSAFICERRKAGIEFRRIFHDALQRVDKESAMQKLYRSPR